MGVFYSKAYFEGNRPDHIPASGSKPTFPHDYGFKAPRKERVMKISEQEMKALKIPKEARDYCAHHLKEIALCRRYYAPFFVLCKPAYEEYHHCMYEDEVLKLKEYEREKRLRIRKMEAEGKTIS